MPVKIILFSLTVALIGCRKSQTEDQGPRARPVSVMVLKETDPSRLSRLSGTVSSWKTEDIGFSRGKRSLLGSTTNRQ